MKIAERRAYFLARWREWRATEAGTRWPAVSLHDLGHAMSPMLLDGRDQGPRLTRWLREAEPWERFRQEVERRDDLSEAELEALIEEKFPGLAAKA